jgi:hypothetical protein
MWAVHVKLHGHTHTHTRSRLHTHTHTHTHTEAVSHALWHSSSVLLRRHARPLLGSALIDNNLFDLARPAALADGFDGTSGSAGPRRQTLGYDSSWKSAAQDAWRRLHTTHFITSSLGLWKTHLTLGSWFMALQNGGGRAGQEQERRCRGRSIEVTLHNKFKYAALAKKIF